MEYTPGKSDDEMSNNKVNAYTVAETARALTILPVVRVEGILGTWDLPEERAQDCVGVREVDTREDLQRPFTRGGLADHGRP